MQILRVLFLLMLNSFIRMLVKINEVGDVMINL